MALALWYEFFIKPIYFIGDSMFCWNFFARQIDLPKSWFKLGGGAFAFLSLVVALNPFYIVEGGHRGIVTKLGAIQNTELEEGLNIVNPLFDHVEQWDVRVFKLQV